MNTFRQQSAYERECEEYVEECADLVVERRDAIIDLLNKASDLAKQDDTAVKDWFDNLVCAQVEDIVSELMRMDERKAASYVDTSNFESGYGDYRRSMRKD